MPPLLVINPHNGVPAYRQLMDQIKFQIATGVLPAGTELASTRALSAELTLNPMTISKAYGLLERDGVLERRRGQTLVVRARPAGAAATDKHAHLREHLAHAATMAGQLGISRTQALKLFRETLDASTP
ncbi:MAG: GntR family transcriptional regulator [Opitutae bacterium]|nr:GntR family transcriptional regulator [Opitutae bacterium]